MGTAQDLNFSAYRLDVTLQGAATGWVPIEPNAEFLQPVEDGVLANWTTHSLPRGNYSLRLLVSDAVGNTATVFVDVFKGGKPGELGPPPSVDVPTFVRAIGARGSGAGEFRLPVGVAVDATGRLWVSDTQNHRIEVFNSMSEYAFTFGRLGAGEGRFNQPQGEAMAVGPGARLYVADRMNDRVQVFAEDGQFVRAFGRRGTGDGEFMQPSGVAVDGLGQIYVSDTMNSRIQVFTADGLYLYQFGSYGLGDGRLRHPGGVSVDPLGRVYVADTQNGRINVYGSMGTFESSFGSGTLKEPADVAPGPDGRTLYVSDTMHHELVIYDLSGTELARFGGFGAGDGKFHEPHGLTWDRPNRLLYVADTHNNRVQVFGFGAPSIAGNPTGQPEALRLPSGLARGLAKRTAVATGGVGPADIPPGTGASGGLAVSVVSLSPLPYQPSSGGSLAIQFLLTRPANVSAAILDKHANLVATIPEVGQSSGTGTMRWSGIGLDGHPLQGGMYDLVLSASDGIVTATTTVALPIANNGGQVPGGGNGSGTGGGPSSPKGRAH